MQVAAEPAGWCGREDGEDKRCSQAGGFYRTARPCHQAQDGPSVHDPEVALCGCSLHVPVPSGPSSADQVIAMECHGGLQMPDERDCVGAEAVGKESRRRER